MVVGFFPGARPTSPCGVIAGVLKATDHRRVARSFPCRPAATCGIGVIGIACAAEPGRMISTLTAPPEVTMLSVQQLLDRKPKGIFSVRPEEPVFAAIQKMAEHHVGALLVMVGDRLAGIV